ncbi:2-phosphosulfolactate phosphatase [Agromyces mangrovi Wang et al. 2018]|uniref:2-phosphosulfolactate phosphatase n=1 Tax=Agromyces mangrovi TaxID=1858653 RepID=UPI002572ED4F|nr:2-phosphosulfolactate phosphatase [Agromyces mangrovi]
MNAPQTDPFDQTTYQVRLEWGDAGVEAVAAHADVVVLVDAVQFTTAVVVAAERGIAAAPWWGDGAEARAAELGAELADRPSTAALAEQSAGDGDRIIVLPTINGSRIAHGLSHSPARVVAASLRNRSAVARYVHTVQEERQARTSVAIIAAGEQWPDGSLRVSVEDQLTAGAVVDALMELGIDHTSPEAAVAAAAYTGLGRAAHHLISATGSARELAADGRRADVAFATKADVTDVVPVLQGGVFRA